MRVLVTGATGFVGGHLTALLAAQGADVVEWGMEGSTVAATGAPDLRDRVAVAAQDLSGVDAIVHLAGRAAVGRSFNEPAEYVTDNSVMQINLFEALLAQRVFPRMLVVSSGAVYGCASGTITEQTPVEATSPYAVSKLTQEVLCSYYRKRGFEVMIARPFNHIGPGQQPGYLVADVASQIAEAERSGHGPLTVGDLSSARDYTDVRDIAAAYRSLIQAGRSGEIYNICSGVSRTGQEIVDTLIGLSSAQITINRSARLARPTDASVVIASSEKLGRDTGWSPTIPLERTLKDTLDYWRSRVAANPVS